MSTESRTLSAPSKTAKRKIENVTLTASDASRLIGICIELIDLCAKVTGKIDPKVGSILNYAREEALSEFLEIGP